MNPPFSNPRGAYIDHIQKAWSLLNEEGSLIAIAPLSFTFAKDKRSTEFRNFVSDNGSWEQLPDDSFKESGTSVSTVLIALKKRKSVSVQPQSHILKLTSTQSDLNTNLSLVKRVVPDKPHHPICKNILLVADSKTQQVQLTAFDLSLGIQTSFSAVVETDGKIAIPAKLLNDIVSRLPEGEITLTSESTIVDTEAEGNSIKITLTSTSGRYQMQGMSAEEFPSLPQIEDGVAVELPVEALMTGVRGSLFATSTDETKQVLTGVHLKMQQENLEFAATDGHRLAVVQTTNNLPSPPGSDESDAAAVAEASETSPLELTLPATALRELERMLGMSQPNDTVALHFEQGQIVFKGGGHHLTSRTLEGQYPAYRKLIPDSFIRQLTIERRQLLSAVERIAVLADKEKKVIKFNIDSVQQQINLSVNTQLSSGQESVSAQISGESLEIGFNFKYLIEGLKTLSTDEIQMLVNEASTPVILTPLGGLKMTYLIMPIKIHHN
ncbi:MAG: DNA polymerase III subunit beta [Symploca sp. SIO2D2]|nr:DNA polymerase III subunit beta [Symploca sp. SIO2D2]